MTHIADLIAAMRRHPHGIRFRDLCRVCDFFFGKARQSGSSHRLYKTPWQGDPRINMQHDQGMAKPYQVRQVLRALDRLEAERGTHE